MDLLQESILKVVAYFDVFDYPVTAEEILRFMDKPCSEQKLQHSLKSLLRDEAIFKTKDFYSLRNDESFAVNRLKDNRTAKKKLKLAKRIGVFLSWFPYIKGIAISGSLSKNVFKEDSDIDFFIITQRNRLWISKIFFSSFTKVATLLGLKKWFCLNYVIDETCFEVPEKNIFTAIEIITLMPLHGTKAFHHFFEANKWVYEFFPNYPAKTNAAKESSRMLLKRFLEWIFDNGQGDKIDNALLHYFDQRWKRLKQKNKFTETGFQIGTMIADKHFCRPYPQHFQQKILDRYEERIQSLKTSLRVAI